MEEYDYKGFTIVYTDEGYYTIDFDDCSYTFTSYDGAADWVDSHIAEMYSESDPVLKTYHIFYVTKSYDKGYDEFIDAYSSKEAEAILRTRHRDIAYIADVYQLA